MTGPREAREVWRHISPVLLALLMACAGGKAHAQERTDTTREAVQDSLVEVVAQGKTDPTEVERDPPPLLWKGLVQGGLVARWDNPGEASATEFRHQEVQLSVEGSPIPGTGFFIEASFAEPSEAARINDAFVTLDLSDALTLVAGQLRVPLNRPAVSARTALFLAEPRPAGPVQRKARDRGVNLVFTPFDGRVLYEQALVNGNGILTGDLGNDDSDLLVQGRLVWFATGEWPLPLPAQTDLQNSPWSTYLKAGWAAGEFERGVTETVTERVGERTWNVGQAIVGKGLYTYWQYSQGLADGEWDFDSRSISVTSGYAIPLRRYLPFLESAPTVLREAWLEPKFQYENLRFDDPTLFDRSDREIYRFGINYYPFGTPVLRLMVENELVVDPTHSNSLFAYLHYMF
jgi:hypothetical protein